MIITAASIGKSNRNGTGGVKLTIISLDKITLEDMFSIEFSNRTYTFSPELISVGNDDELIVELKEHGYRKISSIDNLDIREVSKCLVTRINDAEQINQINTEANWC